VEPNGYLTQRGYIEIRKGDALGIESSSSTMVAKSVAAMLVASTDALIVSHISVAAPRTSSHNVLMGAPYDPRSTTQTFAMWAAAQPPEGFTWGYDTRVTTEEYEQWRAAEVGELPQPSSTSAADEEAVGVPSVGETVLSWYDSGIRITADEEAPVEAKKTEPSDWYTEDTVTLTDEQVNAFGGPKVRALTDRATATEAASMDSITLTDEQVNAFGGPKVRALTDRAVKGVVAPTASAKVVA
jgi:hypothetical protein